MSTPDSNNPQGSQASHSWQSHPSFHSPHPMYNMPSPPSQVPPTLAGIGLHARTQPAFSPFAPPFVPAAEQGYLGPYPPGSPAQSNPAYGAPLVPLTPTYPAAAGAATAAFLQTFGTQTRPLLIPPSGPRVQGQGVEDQQQGILHADYNQDAGAVTLHVTLLASGFVIGPGGSSIREICKLSGADIRSWTQQTSTNANRPCRVFVVQGRRQGVGMALEIICDAVERYKELCEGQHSGQAVSRIQVVRGVDFTYQPPPRAVMPQAAALKGLYCPKYRPKQAPLPSTVADSHSVSRSSSAPIHAIPPPPPVRPSPAHTHRPQGPLDPLMQQQVPSAFQPAAQQTSPSFPASQGPLAGSQRPLPQRATSWKNVVLRQQPQARDLTAAGVDISALHQSRSLDLSLLETSPLYAGALPALQQGHSVQSAIRFSSELSDQLARQMSGQQGVAASSANLQPQPSQGLGSALTQGLGFTRQHSQSEVTGLRRGASMTIPISAVDIENTSALASLLGAQAGTVAGTVAAAQQLQAEAVQQERSAQLDTLLAAVQQLQNEQASMAGALVSSAPYSNVPFVSDAQPLLTPSAFAASPPENPLPRQSSSLSHLANTSGGQTQPNLLRATLQAQDRQFSAPVTVGHASAFRQSAAMTGLGAAVGQRAPLGRFVSGSLLGALNTGPQEMLGPTSSPSSPDEPQSTGRMCWSPAEGRSMSVGLQTAKQGTAEGPGTPSQAGTSGRSHLGSGVGCAGSSRNSSLQAQPFAAIHEASAEGSGASAEAEAIAEELRILERTGDATGSDAASALHTEASGVHTERVAAGSRGSHAAATSREGSVHGPQLPSAAAELASGFAGVPTTSAFSGSFAFPGEEAYTGFQTRNSADSEAQLADVAESLRQALQGNQFGQAPLAGEQQQRVVGQQHNHVLNQRNRSAFMAATPANTLAGPLSGMDSGTFRCTDMALATPTNTLVGPMGSLELGSLLVPTTTPANTLAGPLLSLDTMGPPSRARSGASPSQPMAHIPATTAPTQGGGGGARQGAGLQHGRAARLESTAQDFGADEGSAFQWDEVVARLGTVCLSSAASDPAGARGFLPGDLAGERFEGSAARHAERPQQQSSGESGTAPAAFSRGTSAFDIDFSALLRGVGGSFLASPEGSGDEGETGDPLGGFRARRSVSAPVTDSMLPRNHVDKRSVSPLSSGQGTLIVSAQQSPSWESPPDTSNIWVSPPDSFGDKTEWQDRKH